MVDAALEEIVAAVSASTKYRHVSPEFVRAIGIEELAKRRNVKEAIKATKNKLHQVAGAYFDQGAVDSTWLGMLQTAASSGDLVELQRVCRKIMSSHISTRERLPILDRFYAETLAEIGPVRSVIDIACGLNPLAIPWMPLAADATYYAYDIFDSLMDFLGHSIELLGIRAHAEACDVVRACPQQAADLALVLKAIPCLEQIDKSIGSRLLDTLNVSHMLVSFPSQSLGGRSKGMAVTYEQHLYDLIGDRPWHVRRFTFERELAFLISKPIATL